MKKFNIVIVYENGLATVANNIKGRNKYEIFEHYLNLEKDRKNDVVSITVIEVKESGNYQWG